MQRLVTSGRLQDPVTREEPPEYVPLKKSHYDESASMEKLWFLPSYSIRHGYAVVDCGRKQHTAEFANRQENLDLIRFVILALATPAGAQGRGATSSSFGRL